MPMTSYPCPSCGAPANLIDGCSGCHRPPDPEAAEVVMLDATIAALAGEVEHARVAYGEAIGRLNAAVGRRNELALRVQARGGGGPPRAGPAPAPGRRPPRA